MKSEVTFTPDCIAVFSKIARDAYDTAMSAAIARAARDGRTRVEVGDIHAPEAHYLRVSDAPIHETVEAMAGEVLVDFAEDGSVVGVEVIPKP